MKNPWLTKNPMLSLWLSGANAMLGAARGHAAASAHRQAQAMMAEGARQWTNYWWGATPVTLARKRRGKRRSS